MEAKEIKSEQLPTFLASLGYSVTPIRQNIAGLLIVDAKINGVQGSYMLDTGAGTTVIDAKQTNILKLKLNHEDAVFTGGGVGGHGLENIPSYNNSFEIGNFKIDALTVAVMSLESAWQSLANVGSHDELFGIIGFDVLKSGNAIIDYGSMNVYLIQQ